MPASWKGMFASDPFAHRAGPLGFSTGEGEFFAYSTHAEVLRRIRESAKYPASMVVVIGGTGMGKSWSLAHFARKLAEEGVASKGDALVLPIPSLGYEKLSRGLGAGLMKALQKAEIDVDVDAEDTAVHLPKFLPFFQDPDAMESLSDGLAKISAPKESGVRALSMSREATIVQLVLATVELAEASGYKSVFLVVDELDAAFGLAGARDIRVLLHVFRDLYDQLESRPSGATVQFIFGASENAAKILSGDPAAVRQSTAGADVITAFKRRVNLFLRLNAPSEEEIVKIADYRIRKHYDAKHSGKRFIPFKKAVIPELWNRTSKNLGDFSTLCQLLYDYAARRNVEEIDEKVVANYLEQEAGAGAQAAAAADFRG